MPLGKTPLYACQNYHKNIISISIFVTVSKAEVKKGALEMSVTFLQKDPLGTTSFEGTFTGLNRKMRHGLTIVQATDINSDCTRYERNLLYLSKPSKSCMACTWFKIALFTKKNTRQ